MKKVAILAVVLLLFGGLFSAFAAAEGNGFDDAKVIGEGTYTGTVSSDYYFKVTVPAEKSILVTLKSGDDSTVYLTLYDSNREAVDYATSEDGATDIAFYDGKSTSDYTVYFKLENGNVLSASTYSIQVQFRPSDIMSGATSINSGSSVSGKLLTGDEVHWYKINVPKGEILNVTFTSTGGNIYVGLYDADGNAIDSQTGTSGYVNTKLLGNSGTIYIKVTSFEFGNREISYTITPEVHRGTSEAQEAGNAIATTCLVGIVIAVIVVILLIVVVMKMFRKKKQVEPAQDKSK